MVLPTSHALTGLEQVVADGVADRLRMNVGTSPTLVANTVTSVTVTFTTPFAVGVVPNVVVGTRGGNPNTRLASLDTTAPPTNTGFTVNVVNTANTGAVSFSYIAFG